MNDSLVSSPMINAERTYNTDIYVNTRNAFLAIARALDYVGIDDIHHAHRVAYIAYECGQLLNWPALKLEKTFYASLLHDCGVTTNKEHLSLLEKMSPSNADEHCKKGHDALKENSLLNEFSNIVRFHHTSWKELRTLQLDDETRDITALIHLADRVDFLRSNYTQRAQPETVTMHKGLIAQNILSNKGSLFQPDYAETMARLVSIDGFWFSMRFDHIEAIALNFNAYKPFNKNLNILQIKELALFLGNIVDAKSPFTFHHSKRVANISKMLAIDLGLSTVNCELVYVAGLLHDVGKLGTPDAILYKKGPLDDIEFSIMKRHPNDSLLTLDDFFPDSKIGQWAANHHEKLDGSGYPYHLKGEELDIESRIISIADIFQALSQDRPYRDKFSFDGIVKIMNSMVDNGEIDKDIFKLILAKEVEYSKAASSGTGG